MRKSEVLAAESVSCLNKALILLTDVWEEIGIQEEQRLQRISTVKKNIQVLLEMMIDEELSLKRRLEKNLESNRREIHNLCLELELEPPQEEHGQSLLQVEKDLRTRVEFLLKEKLRRMEELKDLLRKDQELSQILGTPPSAVSASHVPSTRTLRDLKEHLRHQQEDKSRREVQFQFLRDQILVLVSDLDHSLDLDLDQFCLSTENLNSLSVLQLQLQRRRSDLEDQSRQIQDQIQTLWNRLEFCEEERDAFFQSLPQEKVTQRVQQLQREAERLERLKTQNIKSVSDKIRGEISEFWDKCFCSEEQRLGFITFYTDEVSERVLEALEAELQRLKVFYEEHRPIMEGVQKWMDQWELFLELERKASDPSRFTNRGGNLLKEERQRSEISKSLPKLERVLRTQISLWEQSHGAFLVKGLDFLQFVEQQWVLLQEQRKRQRSQRLLKKARQTEEDMIYGTALRTPTKRRFNGTSPCRNRAPSQWPRNQNRAPSPGPRNQNRAPSPGPGNQNRAPSPGPRNQNRAPSPGPRNQNRAPSPGPRNQNRAPSPGPRNQYQTQRIPLSACSLSTNSTLRSVQSHSPRPHPPRCPAQIPLVWTPVCSKPAQPRVPALNQDQTGTKPGLTPDPVWTENRALDSVASTYSEFVRDLSESRTRSRPSPDRVLSSTDL